MSGDTMLVDDKLKRFFEVMARETAWRKPAYLKHNLRYLFEGLSFVDKTMLEIGAGIGVFSLYALSAGAKSVVCLEPEAAGSSAGMQQTFDRLVGSLGVSGANLLPVTFQDYRPSAEKYDVVLLHNSINHLDEEACIRLHRDGKARETYRAVFSKMCEMMNPGGRLVMADCSRHNIFAHLGLKNPLLPTVEWHKHQPPGLWAAVAGEAGFVNPTIRWKSLAALGPAGRVFLANKVAAYFLMSHFVLTLEKP